MRVYISSEDAIDKPLMSIMSHAKELAGIEETIEFSDAAQNIHDKATVLALGKYVRKGRERVVTLPSAKALVMRADSISRLMTAFRMLVDPPELEPMHWRLYNSEAHVQELREILYACKGKEMVVDIETSGDVDADLPSPERIISVGIFGGKSALVVGEKMLKDARVLWALDEFLENNLIITVNGKFDLKYFPNAKGIRHFDVMLAHYALFPAAGAHGLKDMAKTYLGAEDWDSPNKVYTKTATYSEAGTGEDGTWHDARRYSSGSGYERIPRTMLYEYCACDVYYTWHLYEMVKAYLADDPNATKLFEHLMRCSDELYLPIELRGITFNVPYMLEMQTELTKDLAEAHGRLKELAERDLNYGSYMQVGDYFAERGVPLKFSKKNKQGKRTYHTDEKTITAWLEKHHGEPSTEVECAVARQILECRKIKKELGTYITGYLKNIHGSQGYPIYKLHASTTGRLGGGGPSMLTIPRDKRLKRMVIPSSPDRFIVGADLSQAELRVMALESKDPWMIAAFAPDAGDIFDILLSAALPDIDWPTLHKNAKAGDDPNDFYENMRARMKGVVYGVSFGRGVRAIAASLKISIGEAQLLIDGFVRPGSDFAAWREDITNRAVEGGNIQTVFGRYFQSEVINNSNRQNVINSALAFTSQSTANDICLSAALAVVPQLAQYDSWMLGTIHDAIYCDVPAEHTEAVGELVAAALKEAGAKVYGDLIPFTADWKAGKSLAG